MLSPNDKWLLAISGGQDSMAMMHAVVTLQPKLNDKLELHVAHLNHRLRGEQSDSDERFVIEQAGRLNLPVSTKSIDVRQYAAKSAESIETAARELRYEFLAETADANRCKKIAMAHHADDNVETILHRIIRGTGMRGLAGIEPVRPIAGREVQVVRPMLELTRGQIEQFVNDRKIECRLDKTNLNNDHTRNRIRNELLPLLRSEYNGQVDRAISSLAAIAGDFGEILAQEAAEQLAKMAMQSDRDSLTLDAEAMGRLPRIHQAEILHLAMAQLKVPQRHVGYRQIIVVLDMLANRGGLGKKVQLPGGLWIEMRSNKLTLTLKTDEAAPPAEQQVTLTVDGTTAVGGGYVCIDDDGPRPIRRVSAKLLTGGLERLDMTSGRDDRLQELLDADAIEGPLQLRTRQRDDRFRPIGSPGEKTLGDFFTDCKIPTKLRDRVGLICDEQKILWVAGLRIAESVRLTAQTRRIVQLVVK